MHTATPACAALCACLILCWSSEAPAEIVFNFGAGTGNAQADAGFTRAANYVRGQFDDDVTINITTGFSNLGAGILGQAGSTSDVYTFTNWKTQMFADVTSADDVTMTNSLPGGSSFSVYINRTSDNPNGAGSATPFVDSAGANTTQVDINSANAKALGLLAGNAPGQDAQIFFSSQFTWDFDPTDGISVGAIDFVGVAIHEIMHSMGFVSGVDLLDGNGGGGFPSNVFNVVSGLDFTRFSSASITAGADIDLTADNRAKFFSIDGGLTNLTPGAAGGFSTGRIFGDGRQASHWKDNLGWGIMDPTSAPAGTANFVSTLDLQALDVIGWNLTPVAVPEPGSLLLLSLCGGSAAIGVWKRRRNRSLPLAV